MTLSPLAYVLIPLAAAIGFIVGRHTSIDLGDPVSDWKARRAERRKEREATLDWPVILPRRPLTAFLAVLTAIFLATTVLSSVSWLRAQDAQQDAERTADNLTRFTRCYAKNQADFQAGYTVRVAAANGVAQALEDAFRVVVSTAPEDVRRAEFQRVIDEYLDARREQEKATRLNPPPPAVGRVCPPVRPERND